ncbi:hypothetical protein QE429_000846 [Bacillus sp. SORGH_AS 510]|uniref:hypothetical protein n=1 Tax=Bacillus sp. SORGH_AS_0510 TaxID=3041771 RepID=UPI00277F4250|nr:hypothetical protein [Bacillus sp. SORGH_AS_0510]MDQ1144019.1 hypothetical protein [Bacillus sp. SORGH_AS_0510]
MIRLIYFVKATLLGISAILVLLSMVFMVWIHAFPKDPEMEERMAFVEKMKPIYEARFKQWEKEKAEQHK